MTERAAMLMVDRIRPLVKTVCLLLALLLALEAGALPALAVPPPRAPEPESFIADVMRREFARIGGKAEAFLKELESLAADELDPELAELLADPSITTLSADVTAEFSRFLEREYPDIHRKFFEKAPDMLGIEVDIVFQVLRSDDLKDAEGLREKLRQAVLLFKGDAARIRTLMLDDQFRSLVKLSGEPVLHNLAKDTLVGAFVGCGLDAGLNMLLGKPFDPKEFAGKVALDFVRSFLADTVKRTVTKAMLARVATGNKVLYTAIGRFGMVSGTFVGAIVGMVGNELLDWILRGDSSGLKRLADHPELLLERGAMCVAGQLLGEAFSWAFAAIGSAFGPIGTVVGKALGFVVGYAIGYCVVGKIIESRRDRAARDFIRKARYFRAREERARRILEASRGDAFQRLRMLDRIADHDYADLVKALGGHPPDGAVTVAAAGDSAEARRLKETLADAARALSLDAPSFGLLVKQIAEVNESASFLRAFEADYEAKVDRDLKRFSAEAWESAANAGDALDGALDGYKGTPWYDRIRDAIANTDLIDPELNLWAFDRHTDRLVRLGPAFVGEPKETVFVTEKPSDRGAMGRTVDAWVESATGQAREPRLRDYLSRYYVMTDEEHFPWHYNPLVDDWAPRYALPGAAAEGVLAYDPDAAVGQYGGATETGLALLSEMRRIDEAARKEPVDLSRDIEAMAATLLHAGDAQSLPEPLARLRDEMRRSVFGLPSSLVFRRALAPDEAWETAARNLTRLRAANAFLFATLYDLVRPDEATLALFSGPFAWEFARKSPEEVAALLQGNLDRIAAFMDLARTLGAQSFGSVKALLAALDHTPSAAFFRAGLAAAQQREFAGLAAGGLFGSLADLFGRVTATAGGNAGGRPVSTRAVKPERLGRALLLGSLHESVFGEPFAPTARTERERAFLPVYAAALAEAKRSLTGSAAPPADPPGVRELDRRLKSRTVR